MSDSDDGLVRLQKLLAQSGVASRRKCEELMLAGEVEVDGEVVTRLGTKVDPRTAVIRVDGKRLPPVTPNVYLVLNKPRGVVSTMSDPEGRRTLTDVIEEQTAQSLDGIVERFRINWVWMPPWGPERITDDGRDMMRAIGFSI